MWNLFLLEIKGGKYIFVVVKGGFVNENLDRRNNEFYIGNFLELGGYG